jgi:hypothetical protein
MAEIKGSYATVVDEPKEKGEVGVRTPDKFDPLVEWVVGNVDKWRDWRNGQYQAKFDEYERLARGVWSPNEKLRESERSKIVTPALAEAVENGAAEIEEATFGRGVDYFDIEAYDQALETAAQEPNPAPVMPEMGMNDPNMGMGAPGMLPAPPMPQKPMSELIALAVDKNRTSLKEDLGRTNFAASVAKCIFNSGLFGLGIGEIVTKTIKIKTPKMPVATTTELKIGTLRSISPRNFVYDPLMEHIDDGLGCAIEENMSKHVVQMAMNDGTFRKIKEEHLATGQGDPTLSGDQISGTAPDLENTVHAIRYFGLVPERLLFPKDPEENVVSLYEDDKPAEEDDGKYCEALVVILNKQSCVKAVKNPFMMNDRPIVLFPWDVVPGRLNGRGLCEKGAHPQKVLDAEVRARLDALAWVTAPMMAMDANRMPRGFKFKFSPGTSILTGGNPQEILHPFKFGELDANHWQNLQACMSMVQQATGSLDAAAMAGNSGNARPGAVSMMMAPVIKRYKRTMVHFTDLFLMPAIEKITYRNMQTMPERYPAVGLKFKANSTMGIMQREYETSQLTQLMSVLEPGTGAHRAILLGIVGNTSIPNREEVVQLIKNEEARAAQAAAASEDPQMKALQGATVQLQIAEMQAKTRKLNADAGLAEGKTAALPMQLEIDAMAVGSKGMYAVPEDQQQVEWDRRMEYIDRELEGAKLQEQAEDRASNERITHIQMNRSAAEKERDREHKERLEHIKASNKPKVAK